MDLVRDNELQRLAALERVCTAEPREGSGLRDRLAAAGRVALRVLAAAAVLLTVVGGALWLSG